MIVLKFGKNETGLDLVDSRDVAKAVDIDHTRFFQDVILRHQKHVEEMTRPFIMLEKKPDKKTKGGRPQRYTRLCPKQLLILLSLTKTTPQTIEAISLLADILSKSNKPQTPTRFWAEQKERVRPWGNIDPECRRYFREHSMRDSHFSPEEKIFEFLSKLEINFGYNMNLNFEKDLSEEEESEEIDEYPGLEDDAEKKYGENYHFYLKAYETLAQEDYLALTEYDFLEKTVCSWESPNLVWVNRPIELDKKFEKFEEYCVIIESEPESKKAKAMKALFPRFEKYLKELIEDRVLGTQPHRDFCDWYQQNDALAEEMGCYNYIEVLVGFSDEGYTIPKIETFNYHRIPKEDGTYMNEDDALFSRVILYPKECLKMFNHYMKNVWYPEYAAQWIQSVDPTGFKQLQQAVNTASKTQLSILPSSFITALQATLPQAPEQKQIAPSN